MGMDHGAGKKKHSKTHSEVAGDNDKHFTSSHQENADSSIHDSETYSRTDDSSGSGTRKDSSSDDNDAYPDRFGSREILGTLFPTTELESFSSSSSSSSSENLFQVDPKKGIKPKPSVPKSDEVTRRLHDKSDCSEKESSDSFEFCDDSAILPTESPPVQTMDRSIYNRSHSMLDWSVTSNDSLFSINVGNHSFSGDQQDVMMRNSEESIRSGELIDYVPSLPVNKKENRERAEVANGGPENKVQNESKAANPKVAWNSSDDSDQSGGNAQCFAFPSKNKHASGSNSNCSCGFCYCRCFTCFSCCTSCSWPYCCKFSCSSCCYTWKFSCQRLCCCFSKCSTKGNKIEPSSDVENEQAEAKTTKETEKPSSRSWFSCFSCAPFQSCFSCAPCRSCFSCAPCRSCVSCFSCSSCFSCFSCSIFRSCFSWLSCRGCRLPSCQCFSCSGCGFPSCQCCSYPKCQFPSCKCFSCPRICC